jgi:hypothetical protein
MKITDWYENYCFNLQEFACPKCTKILVGLKELKKWEPPE